MGDDFVLMQDVENACAEFAQSLETYAEFLRRHPGTEVENGKSLTAAARVVRTDFPAGGRICELIKHCDAFFFHS
jgi:hypothetical protein